MRSLISALSGLALLASPMIASAKAPAAPAKVTALAKASTTKASTTTASTAKASTAKASTAKTVGKGTKVTKGTKSGTKSQGRTIKNRKPHTASKPSTVRK